jgi:hypothetical protein
MLSSSYQEDAATAAGAIGRRWRRLLSAAVASVILFAIWTAPAGAAGPLYAVPSHPPSETKSVDFTNALNHRVRDLPPPLDPPTADTPTEVEARVRVLQRGVVLREGASKPQEEQSRAETGSVARSKADERQPAAEVPGDRAPLSMAFVAAGLLAFLGLLLSARGRFPRTAQGH